MLAKLWTCGAWIHLSLQNWTTFFWHFMTNIFCSLTMTFVRHFLPHTVLWLIHAMILLIFILWHTIKYHCDFINILMTYYAVTFLFSNRLYFDIKTYHTTALYLTMFDNFFYDILWFNYFDILITFLCHTSILLFPLYDLLYWLVKTFFKLLFNNMIFNKVF